MTLEKIPQDAKVSEIWKFINIDSCYYFFIDFANLMDIEIKRAE